METEMISRICKSCGQEIQVPAELSAFSCVYCGAKLSASYYAVSTQPADESDLAYVKEHLLDCVRDYPNAFKQFNRKLYESAYRNYKEDVSSVFEAMDRYVCAQPTQRQALLSGFVEEFIAQWEDIHRNPPKAKTKAARERLAFSDKLTLAWFTVPAIRGLGLSVSEEFPALLRDSFNEKYPDNRFELGTYEEIQSGFRKHGFCFVTTAVCEAEGKPDDCPELTAFRAFRDGWLSQTEQGSALICEYYEIAPAIVAAMRYGDDEAKVCAELRRDWLNPCYKALQAGENAACREIYTDMIHSLRDRYGLYN